MKKKKPLIFSDWKDILSHSIINADQLSEHFTMDKASLENILKKYPMKINPYYLSLIKSKGDPVYKQVIPELSEITSSSGLEDPLFEESDSPVKNIIHRYPDRVLFLVSNKCTIYCRFCMRKRKIGNNALDINEDIIKNGLQYIAQHKQINEIILSGGDPLMLEDEYLNWLLRQIKKIKHIQIIRIHSKIPCALPQRITNSLVKILKKYPPIYIITHFNHPDEITEFSSQACIRLSDVGISLGCQTVLLKDVNNNPETIKHLMKKLLTIRIRPYYIHHPDYVKGTCHFRIPVNEGLQIMKSLRGHISGIGVPQYMIDLPGGGGKIPLLPEYVKNIKDNTLFVENFEGKIMACPDEKINL